MPVKIFNGKTYDLRGEHNIKHRAQTQANIQRSFGNKARVIDDNDGSHRYKLYVKQGSA